LNEEHPHHDRRLNTAMYVGKRLLWDWKDLVNAIQIGMLELCDKDAFPTTMDDEYVKFCKIKLNVRSLIYRDCTADDLIDGWNSLSATLDLVRVVELILSTSLSRLEGICVSEIYKFEPDVIDFLKICYWYSLVRRTPAIIHKTKELRTRLTKRLLYKLESNKESINYDGLSDLEIQRLISKTTKELKENGTDITRRKQLLNEYSEFVSIAVSEFMFPALAQEYGHGIVFEPSNKDYDFDVKIDDLPFQVKTLIPKKYFPISDLDIANHQKYIEDVAQIQSLYYNKQLNQSYVQRRVLDYVKKNCVWQINKSLEQKAKAVILDATQTCEGWLLNQMFADDEIYVKFDESLKKCIKNYSDEYVNVIFASMAYDYNYRISTLAMKLQVKDGKVDESHRDNIHLL
jgi:hypothetical protein